MRALLVVLVLVVVGLSTTACKFDFRQMPSRPPPPPGMMG
jgi:outer membrane lipopolysaccharide assembly protein LptE/RlpB